VLTLMGLETIEVTERDGKVHLLGSVETEEQRDEAIAAAEAIAGADVVDAVNLVVAGDVAPAASGGSSDDDQQADAAPADGQRAAALQAEIDRLIAVNPLIYDVGQSDPSPIQQVVLNNVALAIHAHSGLEIAVVGHTDSQGSDETNTALSLRRAGGVKSYLESQGIAGDRLIVEARGEEASSGSDALAGLERRVTFEVRGAAATEANAEPLQIALVAPSARNDLAFTQSMVDALDTIAAERSNVDIAITDSTFVPSEAAAAIRNYAEQDYDLVIAHGVEFGPELIDMVREFPDVTFAWGTATETFGLPNLYAYDAAAEEGGYVMGAMAASLSESNVVGVVGPIEVGDAQRYVNGFEAGARSQSPRPMVEIAYTGSFGDIALAASTAESHIASGADVLTGSAEMVVGAVAVAEQQDVLWFGTQADQTSLAPSVVVASQVYRWEVTLRPIIADIDNGQPAGRGLVADIANGGLVLVYNPDFDLPDEVRQEADDLTSRISSGSLTVPAN
jgi:basic membrane protein A